MVTLMSDALAAEGFTVFAASNGEECLLRLTSCQPDLVVMDLGMPCMGGLEVLRTALHQRVDPPAARDHRHRQYRLRQCRRRVDVRSGKLSPQTGQHGNAAARGHAACRPAVTLGPSRRPPEMTCLLTVPCGGEARSIPRGPLRPPTRRSTVTPPAALRRLRAATSSGIRPLVSFPKRKPAVPPDPNFQDPKP